jgi:hypothetical protein
LRLYCQGIEYKDGKVEAVYGQEGRLTAVYDEYGVTLTRFRAEYWLKDHPNPAGNTRIGFDWSFSRSESESGFFAHLNDELKRIAYENDFTASELIMLEDLAESSRVLLPEDVGGRAFHFGPIAGARISKRVVKHTRAFITGQGFYDAMDLVARNKAGENKRSQHQINLQFGFNVTIGAEGGKSAVRSFF